MGSLLAVIVVGFAMATLGVALLCLGEVPFLSRKRIPAGRSRLIGLILISFLPLAFGVRQGTNHLFGLEAIQGPVLMWSLCALCWFGVLVILFRVMFPKKIARPKTDSTSAKNNPFGAASAEELEENVEEPQPWTEPAAAKKPPAKKSPAAKPRQPKAEDDDPFNFS